VEAQVLMRERDGGDDVGKEDGVERGEGRDAHAWTGNRAVALAEESADVFTGLGRLDSLVESYRTVSRPRMRIAAFTSFNAVLLPDIIAPVALAHEDLRFDIQLNEPAKVRRSHR
ncbi:hypothetical protein, partial [Burkholderia multivorans]|uniref:hypothetical protein n=1 Tax=Burkholderia multivorans TaxID=87883 RepID=UPI001C65A05B